MVSWCFRLYFFAVQKKQINCAHNKSYRVIILSENETDNDSENENYDHRFHSNSRSIHAAASDVIGYFCLSVLFSLSVITPLGVLLKNVFRLVLKVCWTTICPRLRRMRLQRVSWLIQRRRKNQSKISRKLSYIHVWWASLIHFDKITQGIVLFVNLFYKCKAVWQLSTIILLSLEWKIREIKWSSWWNRAILYSVTKARHEDVVDLMLFTLTSFERHVAEMLAASFHFYLPQIWHTRF